MPQDYTCPNCKQPLENGVSFCGNCGQAVKLAAADTLAPAPVVVMMPPPAQTTAQAPLPQTAADISLSGQATTPIQPQPQAVPTPTISIAPPGPQPTPVQTPTPNPTSVAQVYANSQPSPATVQPNFPGGGMVAAVNSPVNPAASLPSYAVAYPHPKQHRAAIALAIGIVAMGAGLVIAIVGIALGIAGIVLSTTSPKDSSKGLKISSLVVSILAVLIGIAVWVFAIVHDPALHPGKVTPAGTTNGTSALNVTTPCYSVGFSSQLNVNNAKGSCQMNAYNGSSLISSTNIYKVLASNVPGLTAANFATATKSAIEADINKNLPDFSLTKEASTTFSGDTAYYVQANDEAQDVAVIEEGVLHTSSSADNFFVLVHVTTGQSTDLSGLSDNWQWND